MRVVRMSGRQTRSRMSRDRCEDREWGQGSQPEVGRKQPLCLSVFSGTDSGAKYWIRIMYYSRFSMFKGENSWQESQ